MTLLIFILIIGMNIFIHELGHFIFAKKHGVHVYEFAIGMGPQIFKFKRKNDETTYSLRLIPLGGYVSMAGEELKADPDVLEEKNFRNKTWGQKFIIIIAGVMFNFIFALILFFTIGITNGVQKEIPIIDKVMEDYPIAELDIQKGDRIVSIDGKRTRTQDILFLRMHMAKEDHVHMELERDGETHEVIVPFVTEEIDGEEYRKLGFYLNIDTEEGILPSLKYSFTKTYSLIEQMGVVLANLFTGNLSIGDLSGPVGIYSIVDDSAEAGFTSLIYLTALISVNLGFFNILPIPALDGGRLIFLIIEKITKKPVNQNIENTIHAITFFLLMLLAILVTYNDIINLIFKK